MTIAQTEVTPDARESGSGSARKVAAGSAALFAIALFMTVASVNVPHDPSDAELLTWWQDQAHRTSGVVSGISAIIAAVSFAVVVNYLPRLRGAVGSPQWLAFARSMCAAVSAVWLITGAARAAVGHLVDVMGEPLPSVDVLRFATALNYTLLGLSGMGVLALAILAVSVVVRRTQALGRWLAAVGFVCGSVMLVAVVAQYGSYTTPLGILWGLCLAVAIWRQPAS